MINTTIENKSKHSKSIEYIKNRKGLDIFELLMASPYDHLKCLDKKFTEELFYDFNLLEIPDKYNDVKNKLVSILENNSLIREIFLTGFSGCGKTTFIKWFIKELSKDQAYRNYYFYYVDVFSIPKQENKSILENSDEVAQKEYKRIEMSIEIIFKDIFNINNDEKLDIFTSGKFFILINKVFAKLGIGDENEALKIDMLEKTCLSKNNDSLNRTIKKFSYEEMYLIIMLYFMFKMNYYGSFNEKHIIILDNLDALQVQYFNDSVVEFIEKCNYNLELINNLEEFFSVDSNISFNDCFKTIYCIREANYEKLSCHLKERKGLKNFGFTVEFLFLNGEKESYADFLNAWIKKRMQFANKELSLSYHQDIDAFFDTIFGEHFIYVLGRIFNYNFRSMINFFSYVYNYTSNHEYLNDLIREYNRINDQPPYVKQGYKGMLLNILVIYLFKEYKLDIMLSTFEDNIGNFDDGSSFNSLNLFRTILTIALNWHLDKKAYDLEEFKSEKNFMSLTNLGKELYPIFKYEQISQCLKRLSYLNDEDHFYNPASFIGIDMGRETHETIERYFKEGKRSVLNSYASNPPRISINPSGFSYLKYIIPHFEWFSARQSLLLNKNEILPPLFYKPLDQINGRYNYAITIDKVFNQVRICIKTMMKFFNEKYLGYNKFNDYSEFTNSKYAFRHFGELDEDDTPKKIGKMYSIRIFDYHTSYLDSFRVHLMNIIMRDHSILDKKREMQIHNKVITNYIEKYYDLFFFTFFEMDIEKLKRQYQTSQCTINIKIKYLKDYHSRIPRMKMRHYPSEYEYYIEEFQNISKIILKNYEYDPQEPIYIKVN